MIAKQRETYSNSTFFFFKPCFCWHRCDVGLHGKKSPCTSAGRIIILNSLCLMCIQNDALGVNIMIISWYFQEIKNFEIFFSHSILFLSLFNCWKDHVLCWYEKGKPSCTVWVHCVHNKAVHFCPGGKVNFWKRWHHSENFLRVHFCSIFEHVGVLFVFFFLHLTFSNPQYEALNVILEPFDVAVYVKISPPTGLACSSEHFRIIFMWTSFCADIKINK